jgi:DNA mismatch repair protein MutL
MARDDALLALERHATSKIAEAADLDRLHTFGFRGEALPSIASVSRFELQTRPAESDAGTEILVNGGKFVHVRECGRPVGTRIEVTHLFNSVPARRKFLKTDQTEAAHIVQCVRLYALASPRVAFTLIEDGRSHLLLDAPIPIKAPVHIVHGQSDPDVPWGLSLELAERLESEDVRMTFVKSGDHRLSTPADLSLLAAVVDEMAERVRAG